jgi:hypothetical protein
MFRSSPFKPFFCAACLIREYYPRVASLWGNGCFSLIARAGSLHPGGLTRAPLAKVFWRVCFGFVPNCCVLNSAPHFAGRASIPFIIQ